MILIRTIINHPLADPFAVIMQVDEKKAEAMIEAGLATEVVGEELKGVIEHIKFISDPEKNAMAVATRGVEK